MNRDGAPSDVLRPPTPGWWLPVTDAAVCALASVTVLGVWSASRWWAAVALTAPVVFVLRRLGVPLRRDLLVAAVVLVALGGMLSARSWAAAQPRTLGSFQGWATLVTDPSPAGAGVRVVLDVDGQRFAATVFGSGRRRLQARQAGERVEVVGERSLARGPWARRAQVRHVVGDIAIERVGAWTEGTPLDTASNRLRGALRTSAESTMAADQATLFTGLVIGDDTRQPDAMVDDFRSAGLSHLTAVSGQNVAFVLAVVGLGLRSLPRWPRLGATCAVVGWFVVLTRVEPSVLRAGTMAALSATAFAMGRERTATRTLALATIVLLLVDPLLVWSVGFWLSVGATFGVSAIAPVVEPRLRGPAWLTAPLAVTIGAQIGVFVPCWLVFHRMPVVGVGANLLAVPVAGFVMLYGIPAGLVAAMTPAAVDRLVMWPAAAGTRWVSTVATLAARLEPSGHVASICWLVQVALLIALVLHHPARPSEVERPRRTMASDGRAPDLRRRRIARPDRRQRIGPPSGR